MLLNDILAGIILSAAFPLGHLLYLWSKEEVDWVLDNFNLSKVKEMENAAGVFHKYKLLKNLEKIILPFAVISGLLAGFFLKNAEILLILFFANLIIASVAIKEKEKIVLPTILFVISFCIIYFIKYYLLPAA